MAVINRLLVWFGLHLMGSGALAAMDVATLMQPVITIENFGLYRHLAQTEQRFNSTATAGYDSVIDTRFLQQTTVIPLRLGVVFGFNYAIAYAGHGEPWMQVDVEITHPPTTNYLGHHSSGFKTRSAARLKADGRYHNGVFYVFSEPYEMVAGEWQITVSYQGQATVSERFLVVAP